MANRRTRWVWGVAGVVLLLVLAVVPTVNRVRAVVPTSPDDLVVGAVICHRGVAVQIVALEQCGPIYNLTVIRVIDGWPDVVAYLYDPTWFDNTYRIDLDESSLSHGTMGRPVDGSTWPHNICGQLLVSRRRAHGLCQYLHVVSSQVLQTASLASIHDRSTGSAS